MESGTANTLTLARARAILHAGIEAAAGEDASFTIVVLDTGGNVKAVYSMDDSPLMSYDMAYGKAYTAIGMRMPTNVWSDVMKDDPSFGGAITSVKNFVPFGGGIPLYSGSDIVGSVGVSGGTVEQDVRVAEASAGAEESH